MVTLNKPLAGDTNWATPVNNNWTTLEGVVDQSMCQGRLSLSSGNAVYNPLPNTPSSTDTVGETVTFPSAHGWTTGTMVTVPTTAGGLTAGTVYYINAISSTIVSFHSTLAAAEAGTPKMDLTAAITAQVTPVGVSRSTVYFTPFRGNRVSIFDGSTWKFYAFSELSLSLASLIANVTHDLFIYDNAGTLTLEVLAWKKVTATNSPTLGANKVINMTDTSGVIVGSLVTVKDGVNNEIARVNTVVANTSITVDNLVSGYTTPDVYFNSRATDIVLQDGLYVKSGATSRRYLGSLRTTATTGQCEDSKLRRFVWNYCSRILRKLVVIETSGGWGYSSTAWRAANGNNANRVQVVVGVDDQPIVGSIAGMMYTLSGSLQICGVGVGVDSTVVDSSDTGAGGTSVQAASGLVSADGFSFYFSLNPGAGYHFLQWLEYGGGDRVSWIGTSGPAHAGLKADIWC